VLERERERECLRMGSGEWDREEPWNIKKSGWRKEI